MNATETKNTAIQDIFIASAKAYLERYPTIGQQRKAIYSIMHCRGPLMGKHIDKCDRCGHLSVTGKMPNH